MVPISVDNSKVVMDLINTMIFMFDDSSLCLGTEMVEISIVEGRVFSLDSREKMVRQKNPNKGIFISFLLGLSDLSPP